MNNTHSAKNNRLYRMIKCTSIITLCLVMILGIFALTACGDKKKAITSKEFKSTLGSEFEYTDLTSQYSKGDPTIVEVIDAKREDGLELQYWRMKDDISASSNFHYKRHRIENQCPDNNWDKEKNETMVAEGQNKTVYYKASKVGDTVLYTTVTLDNKSTIEKIFDKLGY